MPAQPGPWQLDRVKQKLRKEQIAREKAASERYAQLEKRQKVLRNNNQDTQALGSAGSDFGGCHCAVILLVSVLVFLVFVLVLVLCAVVHHLLKKKNEE
jgi:Flp pilus assembly protein TadB